MSYKYLDRDHPSFVDYSYLTEKQKSYLAGLLDGEGHIDFDANGADSRNPIVTLTMTCEKTVTLFKDLVKGGAVMKRTRNGMKDHWKDCYTCHITTHKAARLCEALLPDFVTKQEVAEKLAKHYIYTCEQCEKLFWRSNRSTTCSAECFRLRKNLRDRDYREMKKAQE